MRAACDVRGANGWGAKPRSLVHIIDKLIKYALANKAFSANSQLQALRLTSIFHTNGIPFFTLCRPMVR